jgi:uncharacterized membrane protein
MISTSHFHPMIVHFPIALVAFGFIADVASLLFKKEPCLSKTGFYLLLIGTLSALAAVATGTFFTAEMSGTAGEVKDTHELFAWITVGILLVTSIIRLVMLNKKPETSWVKWSTLILYGLAAISVSITGFYGGTLVYTYMMPL